MTGRPACCSRCPQPATHVVEAGTPGKVGYRGALTCVTHLPDVRRWAAGGGGAVAEKALGEPTTLF